ncbi:MAG: hypothetical protein PWQ82_1122 [Thermosediminibacterales bacterium]|nr:hypothetical protein [Thermosediminibacterales bacterium]MDK2835684.1 hypothetical protein [Thermosediminibacterales bacterium]
MYRKMLTEKFFDDNLYEGINAQSLIYAELDIPNIKEIAENIVRSMTDRGREEAEMIERENNPDVLLKMLRGKCDVLNYELLHKRVLEFEDELAPRIIKMLINSGNNVFIEHAARIISKCRRNYTDELVEILDKIRSPYAVSLICITLGFIGDERVIPLIYNKFLELKTLYPHETYAQGPLLGLYKLKERFYESN